MKVMRIACHLALLEVAIHPGMYLDLVGMSVGLVEGHPIFFEHQNRLKSLMP